MTGRSDELADVARRLLEAETSASPIDPVSGSVGADEAYLVQLELAHLRRERGEIRSGYKVGLTSEGMQTMLGVTEPDFGHLFGSMLLAEGEALDRSRSILPRAEPELAFIMRSPLGSDSVSVGDVVAATGSVAVAIEIVDSRVREWKITWADTVADNGSSSRYVLGSPTPLPENARGLMTQLEKNGELIAEGPLSEVMGDPLRAVAWLAQTLHGFGLQIEAGDVVLSGSPVKATDVVAGDRVTARIQGVGEVSVDVIAGESREEAP